MYTHLLAISVYCLMSYFFMPFLHFSTWFIFNLICRNSSCIKYSSSVIYCRYFPQFDICLSLLFIMLLLSRMFWRNFYFLCSHIYPFLYCSCSGLWLMALCLILKSFSASVIYFGISYELGIYILSKCPVCSLCNYLLI